MAINILYWSHPVGTYQILIRSFQSSKVHKIIEKKYKTAQLPYLNNFLPTGRISRALIERRFEILMKYESIERRPGVTHIKILRVLSISRRSHGRIQGHNSNDKDNFKETFKENWKLLWGMKWYLREEWRKKVILHRC